MTDLIIRPRINDFYGKSFTQQEVDFAIPFLNEDLPLYIDPFLMWKSPSQQDSSLHLNLVNSFNYLGNQFLKGNEQALKILIHSSECNEIGLGNSKTRNGKRIAEKTARQVLSLYKDIPQISSAGFTHFEEIQLFVDNVAQDRISDISANLVKSFLIDYTIDQAEKYGIPIEKCTVTVFSNRTFKLEDEQVYLPMNPISKQPVLFVPKRWLRFSTFINYDDYFNGYYVKDIDAKSLKSERVKILNFNRANYDLVDSYIKIKERQQVDCKNDPLFKQLPVLSVKRKLSTILKLSTGKTDNADKEYENNIAPLVATMLYPHLDFAEVQSRTDSGVLIRDLIFYNNQSHVFFKEMHDTYGSKQIVFEMKNVKELLPEHINQVFRYLNDNFGKFAVILTRNPTPKKVLKNIIDLWSSRRVCILVLTDAELQQMCEVFESKNRDPYEVIKMKYLEFTRLLPS